VSEEQLFLGGSGAPFRDDAALRGERPLADRMRPTNLDDYVGQEHLVGAEAPLGKLLRSGNVPSCILYGPPGVGKTTLVRLMATVTERDLLEINAVTAKVAELRDLVAEARQRKYAREGRTPLVFVDEIYHFNKQQQNALLPSVESGDVILVGTTTENPFFEINKTLLSRMLVFELRPLSQKSLEVLLERALQDRKRGLGMLELIPEENVLGMIAQGSGGDARQALMRLEAVANAVAAGGGSRITPQAVEALLPKALQRFDRKGDDHYMVISALIKSMRGSDPDAAIYWLARLIAAGEDPRFVARRLLIFAAEDVGLADPQALLLAAAASYAADMTGFPEARIILAEAVIYLASAPKSNSAYLAVNTALASLEKGNVQEVPEHLRPHGSGYIYPHDDPRHWVPQSYMDRLLRSYFPGTLGAEREMGARLRGFWRRFRDEEP
jgi:putative ATPase